MVKAAHSAFLREAVRREMGHRYRNSFGGAAWVLIQPLMTLAVYWYVFGFIFKARLPEGSHGDLPFVVFLAVALWPWTIFSEALIRSTSTIVENRELLGRVPLPRPLLIVAPVLASVLLHLAGFVLVLASLWAFGLYEPRWSMVLCLPLFVLLCVFTQGLAWLISASSVFVRDIGHAMPQVLLLLFFLTPILYPRSLIPEAARVVADANPMTLFVGLFRQVTLGYGDYGAGHWLLAAIIAGFTALVGYLVFVRLAPHFEDFL